MEIRTHYMDKNGNKITDVVCLGRLDRGEEARWENKTYAITSVAHVRNEIFVQLDCEKQIPVLPFPASVVPTLRRKKKIKFVPAVVKPEPKVEEVPAVVKPQTKKKPAAKPAKKEVKKPAKKKATKAVKEVA